MKRTTRFSVLLAGAMAVLPVTGIFAQDPSAAATPSVSAPAGTGPSTGTEAGEGHERGGRMKAALAALTPEERQEFMAARKKAMSDPAVESARADRKSDPKAFRKAMRAAMLKADPNVEAIFEKMRGNNLHKKDLQAS